MEMAETRSLKMGFLGSHLFVDFFISFHLTSRMQAKFSFGHVGGRVTFVSGFVLSFKEMDAGAVCTLFMALLASASSLVSGFG